MEVILKILHLRGFYKKYALFCVNHIFKGTNPRFFKTKQRLLNRIHNFSVGEGTKVVGPLYCQGPLVIGKDCWIGKNFCVNGNGTVTIGNNCDIAPDVVFQTGGHIIGTAERRAGKGEIFHQQVGDGTWIGGRVTILNSTSIGNGCVIAGCACVVKDIPDNSLAAGVPAKVIRSLDEDIK